MYCSCLLIFWLNHALGRVYDKHESFSWCFWVSLAGVLSTLTATCALFVHTIRNKMLRLSLLSSPQPTLDPTSPLTCCSLFNKQRLDRQASSQRVAEPSTRQVTQYHETFTLTRITSINPLLLDGRRCRLWPCLRELYSI